MIYALQLYVHVFFFTFSFLASVSHFLMSHQLVLAILVSKMTTTEYLLISGQS